MNEATVTASYFGNILNVIIRYLSCLPLALPTCKAVACTTHSNVKTNLTLSKMKSDKPMSEVNFEAGTSEVVTDSGVTRSRDDFPLWTPVLK